MRDIFSLGEPIIARVMYALVLALSLVVAGGARAEDTREIEHQGVKRQAIVNKAAAAKDAPKPLLVVLHGRREATATNRSSPALDALAQKMGFVAAYPAGIDGRWNYPLQTAQPSMAGSAPADDLGFVLKLIDSLVSEHVADAKRIYVSGTSNGAFLTYALMCNAPQRFAAVAVLIASMFEAQVTACKPARPVPVMAIAGTNDVIVPYDGWLYPTGRLTSIAETMEFWRRQHGCSGQKSTPLPKGKDDDPTRIVRVDWTGCTSENAVRLYRVEGGEHTLPSLAPLEAAQGMPTVRRSTAMETSEEVWSFFKQWTLP